MSSIHIGPLDAYDDVSTHAPEVTAKPQGEPNLDGFPFGKLMGMITQARQDGSWKAVDDFANNLRAMAIYKVAPVVPQEAKPLHDTPIMQTKGEIAIHEGPWIEQAWNEIQGVMMDDMLNLTQKRAFVISILKGQLANPPKLGGYNG